jgi:hypothetical protein
VNLTMIRPPSFVSLNISCSQRSVHISPNISCSQRSVSPYIPYISCSQRSVSLYIPNIYCSQRSVYLFACFRSSPGGTSSRECGWTRHLLALRQLLIGDTREANNNREQTREFHLAMVFTSMGAEINHRMEMVRTVSGWGHAVA